SPKNDQEKFDLQQLQDIFSLEGINRSNAVVNFKDVSAIGGAGDSPASPYPEETFDPKAVWLNAEHIRALSVEDLSGRLLPIVKGAGFDITPEKMLRVTPLIR